MEKGNIRIGSYRELYHTKNGLVYRLDEQDGGYQEFSFDNNRITNWKKYSRNGVLYEDIVFEWKDGVIVGQTEYRPNQGHLEYDYYYSYTTSPAYGGVIACFQSNSMFFDNLPEALIVQGYFGKWPRLLVSGAVDVSSSDKAKTFTYILDRDGYPISMSGWESARFTWEIVK